MTARRTRVLFAIPMLDRGGPDRVMFELMARLDRREFAPHLLVSRPTGHYLSRLPPDVEVTALGEERTPLDRYPALRALRVIRALAPDVVMGTLRMNLTLGAIARWIPRHTRLVLRPASPVTADMAALVAGSLVKHRIARRALVGALRRADAVICQSRAMHADLAGVVGDRGQFHVIGNPIDIDEVAAATAGAPASLPGAPALVSVGRLVPLKGFDVLVRALALLRPSHPAIHLTILGEGPEAAPLRDLIRALDLTGHVTLGGFTAAPLPAVRAADLFVLASRYDAFANAALEAMACGTPIVLTDVPGASAELVRPGLNGRLAPAAEPAAVARSIDAALAERATFHRDLIRADCRERFDAGAIVAAYGRVFRALARAGG